MKTIDTLAADIKAVFNSSEGKGIEEDALARFGAAAALHVQKAVQERTGSRKPNTLYMSEVGKRCMRQLWYSVHYPELAEPMQGHTLFKFLYGNLLEETSLLLAEAAGHKVSGKQETMEYHVAGWTIRGRQDAVIDDVLVDVKSASSYSYKKFVEGLDDDNDAFGYRVQLSSYNGQWVPRYLQQGFLAIDKQNGHVGFFESPYESVAHQMVMAVAAVEYPREPTRQFALVPDGKSGNEKLPIECAYCPFKETCWRDANSGNGLKAYNYSYGPVFLGTVFRTPAVPQIVLPGTLAIADVPLYIPEPHPTTITTKDLDVATEDATA